MAKDDTTAKKQSFLQRYAFNIGLVMFVTAISFTAFYALALNRNTSLSNSNCGADACVALYSDAADPFALTVKAGSFVQFSSADGKKHNIALAHSGVQHNDPSKYESGDFESDEAWKVQFKEDGSYTFRDKYNDKISVSVVVYTPGKDYKIQ